MGRRVDIQWAQPLANDEQQKRPQQDQPLMKRISHTVGNLISSAKAISRQVTLRQHTPDPPIAVAEPHTIPLRLNPRPLKGIALFVGEGDERSWITVAGASERGSSADGDKATIQLNLNVQPIQGRFTQITFAVKLYGLSDQEGDEDDHPNQGIQMEDYHPQGNHRFDTVAVEFEQKASMGLKAGIEMQPAQLGVDAGKSAKETYTTEEFASCSGNFLPDEGLFRWVLQENTRTRKGLSGSDCCNVKVIIRAPGDRLNKVTAAFRISCYFQRHKTLSQRLHAFPHDQRNGFRRVLFDLTGESEVKLVRMIVNGNEKATETGEKSTDAGRGVEVKREEEEREIMMLEEKTTRVVWRGGKQWVTDAMAKGDSQSVC